MPLAGLTPVAAALLWYALSSVALLMAIFGLPARPEHAWEFVAAVLFPGTLVGLVVGQVDPLLLAMIVGAWRWRTSRPVLGGLMMGAAIAIKLSPVLLLVACGRWRRWRLIAAASVTVLACAMLGELAVPGSTVEYGGRVLPPVGALGPDLAHPSNQGVAGLCLME